MLHFYEHKRFNKESCTFKNSWPSSSKDKFNWLVMRWSPPSKKIKSSTTTMLGHLWCTSSQAPFALAAQQFSICSRFNPQVSTRSYLGSTTEVSLYSSWVARIQWFIIASNAAPYTSTAICSSRWSRPPVSALSSWWLCPEWTGTGGRCCALWHTLSWGSQLRYR